MRAPQLVVTSPPYPGVHVLYHRWQVDGRKEAPLPFMIANKLDGAGSSYYTMGDRKYPELKTYFDNIRATMSSVAALADERTVVVQMVAFSEPYVAAAALPRNDGRGGPERGVPAALKGEGDGRLWRSVPGRRWYSDQRGETPGSQEVVLIHRKAVWAPARTSSGLRDFFGSFCGKRQAERNDNPADAGGGLRDAFAAADFIVVPFARLLRGIEQAHRDQRQAILEDELDSSRFLRFRSALPPPAGASPR